MVVFLWSRTDVTIKIIWTITVIILTACCLATELFASAEQLHHPFNERVRRSVKDNPDPNIALEGQCIVVCDTDVVGLKPESADSETSENQRVQGDSAGNDNDSGPMSTFWDRMSAPVCDGLTSVGRRARKVAFSVKRSIDLTSPDKAVNDKITVTFDHVLVNVGNGFNMDSSTFVAPVSGVYSLYFQVYRLYNKNPLTVDLHVNGIPVLRGFADGETANHNSAHNNGMIHLVALDRVDVKVTAGNLDSGWKYSTFSGYLVFEDENF